jgi:hypothetical protein
VDTPDASVRRRPLWLTLFGVAAVVLLVVFASAFLPRWWSHRVGDRVNESFTRGTLLGLVLGFVFTLVPLLVAWLGIRRLHSWRARAVVVLLAAVLAAPNLLTLSIVVGTGNAAHAGDRTLDVEAPGFRGATLVGALAAAALIAWPIYALRSRRRRRRRGTADA